MPLFWFALQDSIDSCWLAWTTRTAWTRLLRFCKARASSRLRLGWNDDDDGRTANWGSCWAEALSNLLLAGVLALKSVKICMFGEQSEVWDAIRGRSMLPECGEPQHPGAERREGLTHCHDGRYHKLGMRKTRFRSSFCSSSKIVWIWY